MPEEEDRVLDPTSECQLNLPCMKKPQVKKALPSSSLSFSPSDLRSCNALVAVGSTIGKKNIHPDNRHEIFKLLWLHSACCFHSHLPFSIFSISAQHHQQEFDLGATFCNPFSGSSEKRSDGTTHYPYRTS